MKRIAALLLLLIWPTLLSAQRFISAAVTPDPFGISAQQEFTICGTGLWNCNSGYNDLFTFGSRTLRAAPQIDSTKKNLVLILAGQSQFGAEAPTAYSPTNGTVIDNFNIYDGGIYAWADPPLGATWAYQAFGGTGATCSTLQSCGHIGAKIADLFISGDGTIPAGTFDRVIVVPIAAGSSNIGAWDTGGVLSNRTCVALKRLANRGITPSTPGVTFAIVWGQGESDHGTSTAAYEAALNDLQAKAASCGFSGRIFVNVETWLCSSGTNSTDANVQAAQIGVIDNVKFWAGFNADSLGTADRRTDCGTVAGTHFNDTGSNAFAAGIARAMHASGSPF